MPAALPGSTLAQNLANPSAGQDVLFSPFSGPKGSPLDTDVQYITTTWPVVFGSTAKQASGNCSTGALDTGIGFGANVEVPGIGPNQFASAARSGNFTDDYEPGKDVPAGSAGANATLIAIGGGRSTANTVASPTAPNPYALQPLLNAGNGGSRDAGAGPAFTGFGLKSVTATALTANGAAIEAGWINRSGVSIATADSQFGSSTAASPAVT